MGSLRPRDRRLAATRALTHRLLHRAEKAGRKPDLDAALRLVDERLVPAREARRRAATEALVLCRAALSGRTAGGALEGELAADLRVGIHRDDHPARVVLIPTLFRTPDGSVSVLAVQPAGDARAEQRARRYRDAARILFRKRRVRAFLVRPDGALVALSAERPPRSAPPAASNRDSGCSPSGHPRSGRTLR